AQHAVAAMERLDRRVAAAAATLGRVARDPSREQRPQRRDEGEHPQVRGARAAEVPQALAAGPQRLVARELLDEEREEELAAGEEEAADRARAQPDEDRVPQRAPDDLELERL